MKYENLNTNQPFTTGKFGSAAAGDQMWGHDPQAGQPVATQTISGQPQTGQQIGQQIGTQMGQQPMGQQMTGQQMAGQQMAGQQMNRKFGAHELLMCHEVLNNHIDGINQFELYRPHVKDQVLMGILDNQVNHLYNGYQNSVNFLHNQGMGAAVPYRAPKASAIKYGLRQPSPMEPNASIQYMDDRDVASLMMCSAKASARVCTNAALECADPILRGMMTDCAVSAINRAYELFQFMNQRGLYQVPTLADQTTQTMVSTYQVGTSPQF